MSTLSERAEKAAMYARTNRRDEVADVITELAQQRAELLDALKGVMYWDNGKSEWDIAREAITKAEAAE